MARGEQYRNNIFLKIKSGQLKVGMGVADLVEQK
jgi:hypothetical protein